MTFPWLFHDQHGFFHDRLRAISNIPSGIYSTAASVVSYMYMYLRIVWQPMLIPQVPMNQKRWLDKSQISKATVMLSEYKTQNQIHHRWMHCCRGGDLCQTLADEWWPSHPLASSLPWGSGGYPRKFFWKQGCTYMHFNAFWHMKTLKTPHKIFHFLKRF